MPLSLLIQYLMLREWAGKLWNRSSVLGRGKGFFSSTQHMGRSGTPLSLMSYGHQVTSPGSNRPGYKADHLALSGAKVRTCVAIAHRPVRLQGMMLN